MSIQTFRQAMSRRALHERAAQIRALRIVALFGALAVAAGALGAASPVSAQDSLADSEALAPAELPEGAVGVGDVNLFPKRVIIEGRRRIATIGLYNKTDSDGDYEISLMDMAMTASGQLKSFDKGTTEAERARVKIASPFLRYSPRRVTLRGSESQTIRMMARAGSDVPDGEYRSHFLAVSVPRDQDQGLTIDDVAADPDAESIGVRIRPRFGISIPVIVRIGETTLDVGIAEARLVDVPDEGKAFAITLTRSGTRSAFGDLTITARGGDAPIALSRGIGIYPEVDQRPVLIPVSSAADPRFLVSGTELTIRFTDDDADPGKTLAERTLRIP